MSNPQILINLSNLLFFEKHLYTYAPDNDTDHPRRTKEKGHIDRKDIEETGLSKRKNTKSRIKMEKNRDN